MSRPIRRISSFIVLLVLLLSLLLGCETPLQDTQQPSALMGDATQAVAAQGVAKQFLSAWQEEDHPAMYALLSSLSQDALSREAFTETYQDIAATLTLDTIDFQLLSSLAEALNAQVAYRVDFTTVLVGGLSRTTVMNLTWEENAWRIQWDIGMILPELRGGNSLSFVHQIPDRGRILDRNGAPLAAYEDAIAIGLIPGDLLPEQLSGIAETLATISPYDAEELIEWVGRSPADWYLPVTSLSRAEAAPYLESLRNFSGVRIDEFRSRFYVDGGIAPHVLGYRLYIPEDQVEDFIRQGYRQDERIGAAGLEGIFETELSGQRGGSLYLVGPDGAIISLLAGSDPKAGQSVYTTLDKSLQARLQESLGDLRAAVVVMEVETGKVLALVSNPGFDPNAFDRTEVDHSLLDSYFADEDQPLFNRTTQGQYPLGSIFKIITMSAALETGIFRPGSSFYCGQTYWTCDSVTLYDWTYSHGAAASGELTLSEGLMRSCNPWFYRIGETLYMEGFEDSLSHFAEGFGLGTETGIILPETSGNIPETASTCFNSAQMAIGQGEILVTPLQVAAFVAALANNGVRYQPALVERVTPASGDATYEFKPVRQGKLPISATTLQSVLDALQMVIEDNRGTGHWAMQGLKIPVSGKTGTAQTPSGDSHAWFVGFTRQNDPEKPDIAVVVLVENGGEGSVMAAPVFRRAVSLYFSDNTDPGGVMPWETEPYVPYGLSPTQDSPSDG